VVDVQAESTASGPRRVRWTVERENRRIECHLTEVQDHAGPLDILVRLVFSNGTFSICFYERAHSKRDVAERDADAAWQEFVGAGWIERRGCR
jgi:hypothetical protein